MQKQTNERRCVRIDFEGAVFGLINEIIDDVAKIHNEDNEDQVLEIINKLNDLKENLKTL